MTQCTCHSADPTRTLTLRNQFSREMGKRMKRIQIAIRNKDLVTGNFIIGNSENYQWDFIPEKVDEFTAWVESQIALELLQSTPYRTGSPSRVWWGSPFLETGYLRGIKMSHILLRQRGYSWPEPVLPGVSGGFVPDPITVAFGTPPHQRKVSAIYSRAYSSMKGITDEMATVISRILAQGMADGDGAKVIARKLVASIDGVGAGTLGIKDTMGRVITPRRRAMMLARTEIIRAHHVSMIQEYRVWGVEGVEVEAEWRTAGDGRVCPRCKPLQGRIFTLDEIEPMIPLHPQCRCMALPIVKD